MKLPLKSILFDLDGTLVNSLSLTFEAFNQGLTAFGGKHHTPKELMAYFGVGELNIFEKIVGEKHAPAANDIFREFTQTNMGRVPLHPGVREMLGTLREQGIPFGLVTGRGIETTELILAHHQMRDWFGTIVCYEHVSSSKPSPEGILLGMKQTSFSPTETAYVGDMIVDVLAARRAGIRSVAALWDEFCDHSGVLSHSPDHQLRAPADIFPLFTK